LNTVYQVLHLVLYQVLGMKYMVQSTVLACLSCLVYSMPVAMWA